LLKKIRPRLAKNSAEEVANRHNGSKKEEHDEKQKDTERKGAKIDLSVCLLNSFKSTISIPQLKPQAMSSTNYHELENE
jgi:hypothetical protein